VLVEREDADSCNERGETLLDCFRGRAPMWTHRHRQRSPGEDKAECSKRKHGISARARRGHEGKAERPAREHQCANRGYGATCYYRYSLEKADQRAVAAWWAKCNRV